MKSAEIKRLQARERELVAQVARLEARARQKRAILNSITDFAVITMDREGRVTDWNAGAERILGWSADEMRGHTVDRFFTPEDREAGQVEHEMRQALLDGQANDERWHLRKGGVRFWASGEMMLLRAEDNEHFGRTARQFSSWTTSRRSACC